MCINYIHILLTLITYYSSSVLSFNFNSNDKTLAPRDLTNERNGVMLPPSIKFDAGSVQTLPTNEDEMFSNSKKATQKQLDQDREILEINESIKNNEIIDPRTKEKLFQNTKEESEEPEEKEVSLGKSGTNYKDGVDSATEDLNDISRKLESDGGATDSSDIQVRENLLDQIMKRHSFENIGS